MNPAEKFLIIGLGNPGAAYQNTRHNVGFHILEKFAQKQKVHFKQDSHLMGDITQTIIGEKKILMLLPTTFMNLSGQAVRRCIDYYKVSIDHLMVISDDVALPVGAMRIRSQGSCGGHNGLKSIETHLNTQHYARLKIGVGDPGPQILADYVLDRFSQEENKLIENTTLKALEVLELWVKKGLGSAMQMANRVVDDKLSKEGDKND